jgi:hypothetical protein
MTDTPIHDDGSKNRERADVVDAFIRAYEAHLKEIVASFFERGECKYGVTEAIGAKCLVDDHKEFLASLRRENEELKVHNGKNRAAWEAKKTDLLNELSAEKKRSAAYREVAIDERARRMSGDWPDGVCVREATEFVDAEAQKLLDLPKDGGKTV